MNRPIRQIQQTHCKQAWGEKGFAPIVIIIIATLAIGAGVGGFLVFQEFQEKKMPSFETAAMPKFITAPESHGFYPWMNPAPRL